MSTDTKLRRAIATLKIVHADLAKLSAEFPDARGREQFARQASKTETMIRRLTDQLQGTRAQASGHAAKAGKDEGQAPRH